jgi:hypothetical protein
MDLQPEDSVLGRSDGKPETVKPRSGSLRHLKLARRGPRQRPGLQTLLREDSLDHRRFEDDRDDLEMPTAVRAVLELGLKDPLEQSDPGETPYSRPRPAPAHGRPETTGSRDYSLQTGPSL